MMASIPGKAGDRVCRALCERAPIGGERTPLRRRCTLAEITYPVFVLLRSIIVEPTVECHSELGVFIWRIG